MPETRVPRRTRVVQAASAGDRHLVLNDRLRRGAELRRGLSSAELAGGFGLPTTAALPKRIEESFRRQVAPLPADTRQLLVIAAAEPLGDPVLLWDAAQKLGIGEGAEAPAATAGLLSVGARVRFRHPLLRSAIHRAATVEQWQAAHRALAEAIDADTDPDRRAWHRAQATSGLDEDARHVIEVERVSRAPCDVVIGA